MNKTNRMLRHIEKSNRKFELWLRSLGKVPKLIEFPFGTVSRSYFPKFDYRIMKHSKRCGRFRFSMIVNLGYISVAVTTPACLRDVLCCFGILP